MMLSQCLYTSIPQQFIYTERVLAHNALITALRVDKALLQMC